MRRIRSLGYGLSIAALVILQTVMPVMNAYATTEVPSESSTKLAEPATTSAPAAPAPKPVVVEPKAVQCTTNSFDVTLTNESGAQDYTVWTKLKLDFTGAIPDGDTTYIKTATLPAELSGNKGTYNLYAPDGVTIIGHMVSDGHTVTFSFDATYLSTHNCVTWHATLYAGFAETIEPGTSYNLEFLLNGTTKTIAIDTNECPYCHQQYYGPDKWAVASDDGGVVISGINARTTQTNGEKITITDVVDSHQTIRCDEIAVNRSSNITDNRGSLVFEANVTNLATITCSDHSVTIELSQTLAHKVYTLIVIADTDRTLPAYTDTATVTQNGTPIKISRSATVYGGGGGGSGIQLAPAISIEKWDTDRETGARDTADDAKILDATRDQIIHMTIKNTGNEALASIQVSDTTITGDVVLRDLTCDFSKLGGPAAGTTWNGPLLPGDSFDCTGTLPALGYDMTHADRAHVAAVGFTSKIPVEKSNEWHAITGSEPVVTPPTPVTPPTTPVTPGRGNVTIPVVATMPTELPQTGASSSLPMWMPIALGTLTYAVVLKLRKR